jgi:murein tripeptide amidase MpaA
MSDGDRFDGGIHAREWISSHVSVFLIEQLITGYGKVDAVTNLLDNLEFVVSPHINPDGYEHSRLHDRMVSSLLLLPFSYRNINNMWVE